SVNTETAPAQGQTAVLEKESVYASLFDKINLTPASRLGDINDFLDDAALSDAPAGTVPVRSFNYVEQVKGPDHEKYLWTSASFSFASNMVKSFINNGWCVQIRGPQAGGAVKDLPIHLYDLGTGNQVKIPSEVMIPETREFEFASL
ncbi:type VI secretion system contractile sheath domain-containing protein, partial [Klebsiella michiganensis]